MPEISGFHSRTKVRLVVGSKRKTVDSDDILLFFVALTPILQHYKGLLANPALVLTSIFAIVALVRLTFRKIRFEKGFLFLLAYGLYASFIHGIEPTAVLREIVQIVIYLAVINGLFDIRTLLNYCRIIACCATILIIVQYFCFYVLGFHLQLVAVPLLNPSNEQWFGLVRTGMIAVTGRRMSFYRPSAFFLEPSHFAVYCIPVVAVTLFTREGDTKKARRNALFISTGVLLSTSGMGIGVIVFCWAVYLAFFYRQKGDVRIIQLKKLLNLRTIALICGFALLLAVLFVGVPVFRKSVIRIFVSTSSAGTSALAGRTSTGRRALKMMNGLSRLIGFGNAYTISDWNMAAFFFVTFKFGWIGAALFYSFYLYSLKRTRREAQIMTIIFFMLSFFTVHMFGAYYKMYYTMIILYGYVDLRREKSGFMPDNERNDAAAVRNT